MQRQLALAGIIKEKIRTWSITEKGIRIVPKDSLMHIVDIDYEPYEHAELVLRGYIRLSDSTDIWTEILESSLGPDEFSLSGAFRELLGLEVSLEWQGLFRKKPLFKLNPYLQELEEKRCNFTPSDKLAVALNDRRDLLKTISRIGPDNLNVELTDSFAVWRQREKTKDHYEETFNPQDIMWTITAVLHHPQVMSAEADKMRVYSLLDVMETVSEIIVRVSRETIGASQRTEQP